MAQLESSPDPKQNTPFRKILVTGGLGFVGSFVCNRLLQLESKPDVVVLDRFSYAADHRRLERLGSLLKPVLVRGDIRSEDDVELALEGCDAVVHLAAETHVSRSFMEPRHFFDANVTGTENLLKLVQRQGVKHFVHVSTAAVYGSVSGEVNENAPLNPISPYAMSKAMAEEAVMQASQNGLRASILRPANAVGVGQNPEKLFPKFFMQAMKGQPLTIEGSGFQDRSFLPATDLATAVELVLNNEASDRLSIFNVPGQEQLSVLEAAEAVFAVTGRRTGVVHVADRARSDRSLRIDGSKLSALGYEQQSSVKQELAAIQRDFLSRAWLQPGRY
ncbi:dTDP-glucose 4,6-dehydratase [Roseibium album]|nr:dTDP-glucose 4,6-dehydratase [Roseibium album]